MKRALVIIICLLQITLLTGCALIDALNETHPTLTWEEEYNRLEEEYSELYQWAEEQYNAGYEEGYEEGYEDGEEWGFERGRDDVHQNLIDAFDCLDAAVEAIPDTYNNAREAEEAFNRIRENIDKAWAWMEDS